MILDICCHNSPNMAVIISVVTILLFFISWVCWEFWKIYYGSEDNSEEFKPTSVFNCPICGTEQEIAGANYVNIVIKNCICPKCKKALKSVIENEQSK